MWVWAVMLLAVTVLLSGVTLHRVDASVTLKSFKATRQGDGSILVEWETATEIDTVAFRVYRSESPNMVGQVVATQQAQGNSVTGATYSYTDPASELIAGRNYYYRLEELTSAGGSSWHGPVNPGGTTNATSTRWVYVAGTATSTDPPTATRRYTNTPIPPTPMPATLIPPVQPQQPVVPAVPAPKPGPGVVTRPTGEPVLAAIPLPATATQPIPTPSPTPLPTETPTATPSHTPRPTVTPTLTPAPVVFAARSEASADTPTDAQVPIANTNASSKGGLPIGVVIALTLAVGVTLGVVAATALRMRRP